MSLSIGRSHLRRRFVSAGMTTLVVAVSVAIVSAAFDIETYSATVGGREWTAETRLWTGSNGTWSGYAKALSDDGDTLMLINVS